MPEVALWLWERLDAAGLESVPKTSGSKGLQVYVPLNTPVGYEQTKGFARDMAERLESDNPGRVISKMSKSLRSGKVFVDWSQNDVHKTTVCVYSIRARERPTVSTPLRWAEVRDAVKRRDSRRLTFLTDAALQRADKWGDLFKPVLKLRQRLR